jgi:hypothetical protein
VEITMARREGVIAPAYDRGATPPLLAGFLKAGSNWNPRIAAVFSGGDAAVLLAEFYGDSETRPDTIEDPDADLCLSEPPVARSFLGHFGKKPRPVLRDGEARPFLFGTDTAYGLKIAWSQ